MSDTQLDLDLDPEKVIASLSEISEATKKLADDIDKSLGKKAKDSIKDLEDKAESGSTKIQKFFSNLGQRVKEDLKTAFDTAAILEGAKFAKDLQEGVKQVFEMERAFDRLNTRLGLSADKLGEFKRLVGQKVAATGQKLEDVLPGVETMAAKGGIKNSGQLADIAQVLGQVKSTTGEDVGSVADTAIEILKNQGSKITSESVKSTIDAIQATRVSGAFKSAEEAAKAIQGVTAGISPDQLKKMGLNTRSVGGLAAMASQGGEQGQSVLQSILKQATEPGGKEKLNAIFGQQLFKGGKLDTGALGKIDEKRFGSYTEQIMGGAANVDQAALRRFIDSFKNGMSDFNKVVTGSNETANQFEIATDNFASKMDKFKEKVKNAALQVGSDLSAAANDLYKGDMSSFTKHIKKAGSDLYENKGEVAGALAITAGVGLLAGGGMNSLLKKIPGGGLLGKVAGAEAAKAAGITQVYVVNMPDGGLGIGGGAGLGAGTLAKAAGVAAVAYAAGSVSANMIEKYGGSLPGAGGGDTKWLQENVGQGTAEVYEKLGNFMTDLNNMLFGTNMKHSNVTGIDSDSVAKGVKQGMEESAKTQKPTVYTNPSTVKGRH